MMILPPKARKGSRVRRSKLHALVGPISDPVGYAARTTELGTIVYWPEHARHPCAMQDVIKRFRENGGHFTVVTYCGIVLNEFKGDEVSLVTTDANGNLLETLFCDLPGFDDAMKVYQLGEFWISYAAGDDREAELLGGFTRTLAPDFFL